MTAAAFQATYADWRVIKGRKVVQVCFELPLEAADTAYQVLGGMPIAAKEVWCGIARLGDGNARLVLNPSDSDRGVRTDQPHSSVTLTPRPSAVPASAAGADKPKRTFADMSPAQQAGMFCADRAFRLFLAERFDMPFPDPEEAANVIRHHCKVKSRKDITADNTDWSGMVLAYRLWQREPEIVG